MHLLRIHMTVPVHEVNDQGSSLTQDEQRRKTSSPTRGYAECSIKEERPSDTSKIKGQLICVDHEEEVDTRSTAGEPRTNETDSPNQKQY